MPGEVGFASEPVPKGRLRKPRVALSRFTGSTVVLQGLRIIRRDTRPKTIPGPSRAPRRRKHDGWHTRDRQ